MNKQNGCILLGGTHLKKSRKNEKNHKKSKKIKKRKLTGSNNFGQLFHISWLNVNNVKGLICNFHMPQIDPEKREKNRRIKD